MSETDASPFNEHVDARPDRAMIIRVVTVVAIVTLSLIINLAFYTATPQTQYPVYGSDPGLYHQTGATIAEDFSVLLDPARMPVSLWVNGFTYPVLIGVVYGLAGEVNYATMALFQAIMLPLTVMLTYFVGRTVFSHRVGVLGALVYALYLPLVWHANFLFMETFLAFLVTLLLWPLAEFLKTQRPLPGFLAGVALALISITHMAWQFLVWVMLILLAITCIVNAKWRPAWRGLAAIILGAVLIMGPLYIVRLANDLPTMGQAGVGSQGGSWAFYIGSRAETQGQVLEVDYAVARAARSSEATLALYDDALNGRYTIEPNLWRVIEERVAAPDPQDRVLTDGDFYRAGILNWLDQPLRIPGLVMHKSYRLFFKLYSHALPNSTFYNEGWVNWFKSFKFNIPLYALVLVGAGVVLVRYRRYLFLFVPLMLQSAIPILTFAEARYRYPNMPAIMLLAALGFFALASPLWSGLQASGWWRAIWQRFAPDQ